MKIKRKTLSLFLTRSAAKAANGNKYDNEFLQITNNEYTNLLVKSIMVLILLNYFFYRNLWAFLLLLPIAVWYFKWMKKEIISAKREKLKEQFKELLLLALAGMKAGYAAENAFLNSERDMQMLYGKNSGICKMLKYLESGLLNNINAPQLWKSMGKKASIVEMKEFAEIYEIARVSGGNMTAVLDKSAKVIADKLETDKEIETILCAKKLELKIMNSMPFLIMAYMNLTSKGYFNVLYNNSSGVMVMTLCLLVYIGAFVLSVRTTEIWV